MQNRCIAFTSAPLGQAAPIRGARLVVRARTTRKTTTGPAKTQPQLLARVEELKLLSQLEKSGLLSTLEKQGMIWNTGITLSTIEKAGLLSKAESLGLLSAASSTSTPPILYILSLLAIAAGAAIVWFVPDTSASEIVGQLVGAGILIGAGGAAFFGARLLASLQK